MSSRLGMWRTFGVALALFLVVGCGGGGGDGDGGGGGGGVATLISEGRSALSAQDIEGALDKFQQALALDPDNPDANVGVAATLWATLLSDPDVIDIVEAWDGTVPMVDELLSKAGGTGALSNAGLAKATAEDGGQGALSALASGPLMDEVARLAERMPRARLGLADRARLLAKSIPDTAPTVSEMQAVFDATVLADLNIMTESLGKVEGTGFTFELTGAMMGDPGAEAIVLDDGEFYLLDAVLQVFKALGNVLTAYNLDVDYDQIEADPLSALNGSAWGATLSVDPAEFFTLKADGQARMNAAHAALQAAVDKVRGAILFIRDVDPDPFTDGGLNFGPDSLDLHQDSTPPPPNGTCDNLGEWDVTYTLRLLDMIEDALAGQITVFSDPATGLEGTMNSRLVTFTHNCADGDETVEFELNVEAFFTDPLDRTDLPELAYDITPAETLSLLLEEPAFGTEVSPHFSDIWPSTEFPDPTLNGIVPDGLDPDVQNVVLGGFTLAGGLVVNNDPESAVRGIAWDADGTYLWAVDVTNGVIRRVDPADGSVDPDFDIPLPPGDFSHAGIEWHQGQLWVTTVGANGHILRLDPSDGAVLQDITIDAFCRPVDLASDGSDLYVGVVLFDQGFPDQVVVRVDTSVSSLIIDTTNTVYETFAIVLGGLAFDGNGHMFVGVGNEFSARTVVLETATWTEVGEYEDEWDYYSFQDAVVWVSGYYALGDRVLGLNP